MAALSGLDSRTRVVLVDGLTALACAVSLVAGYASGVLRMDAQDASLTALLVICPLTFRRLAPTLAAAAVAVGIAATAGHLLVIDVAAFAVSTFSMADGAVSRQRSFTSMSVIAVALGLFFAHDGPLATIAVSLLIAVVAWLGGDAWRERRVRASARTESERREHDERVRQAVGEERRRLARELHDVIAHDVGIMVVQAGGARQTLESSPERARAAMLTVEATGREALTELRHLLDVLADDQPATPSLAPQPTLADVGGMVERLRVAGLPVELRVEGEPRVLRDGLSAAAYRIVQEALTNAMKHAPRALTEVVLKFGQDALVVEVVDDGPGTSPISIFGIGRGLIGMRERAEAFGGTFEAGPRDGHGFAVRARLPLIKASSS